MKIILEKYGVSRSWNSDISHSTHASIVLPDFNHSACVHGSRCWTQTIIQHQQSGHITASSAFGRRGPRKFFLMPHITTQGVMRVRSDQYRNNQRTWGPTNRNNGSWKSFVKNPTHLGAVSQYVGLRRLVAAFPGVSGECQERNSLITIITIWNCVKHVKKIQFPITISKEETTDVIPVEMTVVEIDIAKSFVKKYSIIMVLNVFIAVPNVNCRLTTNKATENQSVNSLREIIMLIIKV